MSAVVLGTQKRSPQRKWLQGLATYGYVQMHSFSASERGCLVRICTSMQLIVTVLVCQHPCFCPPHTLLHVRCASHTQCTRDAPHDTQICHTVDCALSGSHPVQQVGAVIFGLQVCHRTDHVAHAFLLLARCSAGSEWSGGACDHQQRALLEVRW